MVRGLEVLTALAEGPGSVPSTLMLGICNSSSVLQRFLIHIEHIHMHKHINIKKRK